LVIRLLRSAGLARLRAPGLREAEVEALVGREALEHGFRLALLRELVGVVGIGEAGDVGDVLAQRQPCR
jgi:hypothetical protein